MNDAFDEFFYLYAGSRQDFSYLVCRPILPRHNDGYSAEWPHKVARNEEEQHLLMSIRELDAAKPDRLLDGIRILELANKAHFLYLRQTSAEKAKLLRIALSNCAINAANLYPTYRKPFDLILQAAQTGRW